MPFLLAGLSSLTFGVADFVGGYATRRAPSMSVVFFSQVAGGLGVLIIAPLLDPFPAGTEVAWGAAAGVAGVIGIVILYHALATLRMAVVAPVTAVVGTGSPVIFGVLIGERPEALAWLGVALALIAVVFIATPGSRSERDRVGGWLAVGYGAAAGFTFGLFGILISRTSEVSGLWPLVGARGASLLTVAVAAFALRRPLVPSAGRRLSVGAGLLDMAANVMFLIAVRRELLSLVAVIMSMYPASTIALARVVIGERVGRVQSGGLVLAAVGVSLIVLA